MKITETCIKNPVFAWMMMACAVVFGIVAVSRMGISQYPDVDRPTVTVYVNWEGAAPEVIENDVVETLEEALVQVEGVKAITSSCRQGNARIAIELALSRDVDLAVQDVQAVISQAQRRLPSDLETPYSRKSNPEDSPIMWASISGPFPNQVLSDYARYRLKERLQTVPGVGEIMLGGYLERNVRIWVDADKLDAKGLTIADVSGALRRQHIELPAGRLETTGRELNVRVLGEALDLETLSNLVLRSVGESPVYLKDVALVEDGFEDVRRIGRVNGRPAQGVGVKKQRGANAVAVGQGVRQVLDEVNRSLPEGMDVGINYDATEFIEESVHEIQFELVLSVILTALVCWMFLGSLSTTLNVILAIPMSLLGTIAIIYFLGFTLNTFTLLALALAVGIVVDDAIMVLENIFRHGEEGKDRVSAARDGTNQISFAALAATMSVVAIFIPVVFMEGVVGKFFLQFGVTLSLAVMLSFLEAVTLAPARCAQFLNTSRENRNRVGQWVDRRFNQLSATYREVLEWGLARPRKLLVAAAVLFAASVAGLLNLPSEFAPSQDQSRLMLSYRAAVGIDIHEMNSLMRQAEEILLSKPEVKRIYTVVGGWGGGEANSGFMYCTLVPPGEREFGHMEIASILRKDVNAIPGLRVTVRDPSQSGFASRRGYPVEFSVRGSDWPTLVSTSQSILRQLDQSGLVQDLDTDYRLGMPELHIRPDRARAADLGVPVQDVATTINAMVGGARIGKYNAGGRRIDVRMRLLADQRSRPEDIARLRVRTASGDLVPLSSLVSYEERPVLQTITRRDRERAITITANVAAGHAQDEVLSVVEQVGSEMPLGTRIVLEGASVEFRDSMGSLVFALILGIIVAYMILASQFNSFLHPVTVLTILPLSVVGALIALFLAGKSLNIFSMIGLLLLMGIVKKNSIILVDYANQLREGGLSALDAMREAGPVRLRPILMTACATLMAALPPALGLGPGAEIRTPMALAVIGGLLVSTGLSLLVVPAFYVVTDGFKSRIRIRAREDAGASQPHEPAIAGK